MDSRELNERLLAEIEERREAIVAATSQLLRFETISGATDPEDAARHDHEMLRGAAFLEGLAREMGFRWISRPGRWYCAEWDAAAVSASGTAAGPSAKLPTLAVATHLDVVPAGGAWRYPPFAGQVAEGRIWGRGAVDMKGPLIASLFALDALRRAGFQAPVRYRLIIGTREEINEWSDIHEYLAEEGPPDYAFTPDASFPIVLGEKGSLHLRVRAEWNTPKEVDGMDRPGSDPAIPDLPPRLAGLRGGTRGNVVADQCICTLRYPNEFAEAYRSRIRVQLDELAARRPGLEATLNESSARRTDAGNTETVEIVFAGKSAHGSTPEKGRNAILDALAFLSLAKPIPDAGTRFAHWIERAAGDLHGGGLGIASANDFLGPTTLNLGVARIADDGAEALFNIRPTLGLSLVEVERRVGEAIARLGREAGMAVAMERGATGYEAQYVEPESIRPFMEGLREGFETVTGLPGDICAIPYTTYAKAFPRCCAFGPVLREAGEVEQAHQPDEHVSIESQLRNTRIFALALGLAAQRIGAK